MLNRAEFNQLKSPVLSHLARTMYIFYLRPQAPQGSMQVDPMALTSDLVSHSLVLPSAPTLNEIEGTLSELEQEHLIARVMPNIPWQGALIIFPLYAQTLMEVPHAPFRMYAQWQPGPSLRNAALLAGLVDFSYQESELASFINFWLERAALHNQYGWERLFIQRLLKLRTAETFARGNQRPHLRSNQASVGPHVNSIKSSQAQNAVLPATVTRRDINHHTKVRSNHATTTQASTQIPTLRGMLGTEPQYELMAAGYTDEVSKERQRSSAGAGGGLGAGGYETYHAASNDAQLLPRFSGILPQGATPSASTNTPQSTPSIACIASIASAANAEPIAPKPAASPTITAPAASGGFDLDYLKELDAAFGTSLNRELMPPENQSARAANSEASTALSPAALAPRAEPSTPDQVAPQAEDKATSQAANPTKGKSEGKTEGKATAKRGSKRKAAVSGGGYQRMDFSKLGIETELS